MSARPEKTKRAAIEAALLEKSFGTMRSPFVTRALAQLREGSPMGTPSGRSSAAMQPFEP
jgi:hypothetical protein